MAKSSLVINASNLHVGGGVAVATSFISHLATYEFAFKIKLVVSTAVDSNLAALETDVGVFKTYIVHDSFFLNSLSTCALFLRLKPTAIFTIFGPIYFPLFGLYHLMGLADPYILYPDNHYLSLSASNFKKLYFKLYIIFKSLYLANASFLILETSSAEISVNRRFPKLNTTVIPSGYHDIHLKKSSWQPISFPIPVPNAIKLGLISKSYPHKDLHIVPQILNILNNEYYMPTVFYCTLTVGEYNALGFCKCQYIFNVGPLTLSQCPSFYNYLDGVLFPTLLESFSAVVPESLIHRKPLFLSDIQSLRDVAKDNAYYFHPHDPANAALVVSSFYRSSYFSRIKERDTSAPPNAIPSASDRSKSYISMLSSIHLI